MPEPSLKYTTVRVMGRMRSSDTEFMLGRNTRREYREGRGRCEDPPRLDTETFEYGPLRAEINNRDLHYTFELDLEARVYTATRVNDFGSPVWLKPCHMPTRSSGRTRYIHIETVDTGERREIFGHMGRHVITRRTEKIEPSGTAEGSESETGGWYIDPPAAWLTAHPSRAGVAYLSVGASGRDEIKLTESGPRENGFPLLLTHTYGSRITHQEEVTELSEDALSPDLFLPPATFKRVPLLPPGLFGYQRCPLRMRLRLRWEMFKDHLRPGFAVAR